MREWTTNLNGAAVPMTDITQDTRAAQLDHRSTFLGLDANRLCRWDQRTAEGVVQDLSYVAGKDYSRGTNFTCMATSGDGYVAVGARDGRVRLYGSRKSMESFEFKQACTAVPGLGLPITAIDVSFDSRYVVATTDKYLLVIQTFFKDAKGVDTNGFVSRMGSSTPPPKLLKLAAEDRVRVVRRWPRASCWRPDSRAPSISRPSPLLLVPASSSWCGDTRARSEAGALGRRCASGMQAGSSARRSASAYLALPSRLLPRPRVSPVKPRPRASRVQGADAKFSRGRLTWITDNERTERWIAASCGRHTVLWNFRRVKAHRPSVVSSGAFTVTEHYTLMEKDERVVDNAFLHDRFAVTPQARNALLVATEHGLYNCVDASPLGSGAPRSGTPATPPLRR